MLPAQLIIECSEAGPNKAGRLGYAVPVGDRPGDPEASIAAATDPEASIAAATVRRQIAAISVGRHL